MFMATNWSIKLFGIAYILKATSCCSIYFIDKNHWDDVFLKQIVQNAFLENENNG